MIVDMQPKTPEEATAELFSAILANQQNLHDDIAAVLERLSALENAVLQANESRVTAANDESDDDIYPKARQLVVMTGKCSTSMLQRIFRIGYSRAARLADVLEQNKVVGLYQSEKPREVLMTEEELELLEEEEMNGPEVTGDDDLYNKAKALVLESRRCSTSYLQRKLGVGYSRAAHLVDMLEENGVVGPGGGLKPREVLQNS